MTQSTFSDQLEPISLKDSIISFSRLSAHPIRYHHWHQCLEILYVERGYGVVIANNRHYTLRAGRLFIFPPFTLHKIMVEESARDIYRRTIIHVDQNELLHAFTAFPRNQKKFLQFSTRGGEAVVMDLSSLHDWLEGVFERYSQLAHQHELDKESVMLLLLTLLSMLPEHDPHFSEDECRLSSQVMFWIEENYRNKFSLDRLAADLNMSSSYVSRRFHLETGERINDYITTFRLRKSCELLLRTALSIQHIAQQVGYSDATYFISSFRKGIGESPLQYRKKHQGGGNATSSSATKTRAR